MSACTANISIPISGDTGSAISTPNPSSPNPPASAQAPAPASSGPIRFSGASDC